MSHFEHDELPPDLSALGRRMRHARPVADEAGLDRMMRRARTPSRPAPRRAPRRVFAVSLATMLAMVSVTGVAAAAFFGMNLPLLGNSLTNSSQRVGTASSQALRAPAAPTAPTSRSSPRLPATIGSAVGGIGSVAGVNTRGGGNAPRAAVLPAANAGNFQYNARRLVCRILRALGLGRIARLLGCS